MKKNWLPLAALLVPTIASAQVLVSEDFEAEFPGPGTPAFVGFTFAGDSTGDQGGTTPVTLSQEISSDGVGGSQAYKVTIDAAGAVDYHYGGIGAFPLGFDVPFAGQVLGSTNPANYVYSFDLRVEGGIPEAEHPLRGNLTYFDPDYEATFGVDVDNDGEFTSGADSYILDLNFEANDTGFTTNSFRLNEVTPRHSVEGFAPFFGNQGTIVLNWFWGGGEFEFDADNVVTLDNIQIEFFAPTPIPGDYTADGVVDAADYVVWRNLLGQEVQLLNEGDGVTPGVVTEEDLAVWKQNYGTGAAPLVAAIPEPSTAALVLLVTAGLATRRRG